jgi:hypothetical protein
MLASANVFAGLHCSALREWTSGRSFRFNAIPARMRTITPDRESSPLIFENCIEKNFHVPNMKSGPREERGCNFDPKTNKK